MFDEEPEGDPHGECAKEIHELQQLSEESRRVAENEAASAKQWREDLAKANLQNDELGKQLSVQLGQIQALELRMEERGRALKQCEDENSEFMRKIVEAKSALETICVAASGRPEPILMSIFSVANRGVMHLSKKRKDEPRRCTCQFVQMSKSVHDRDCAFFP